MKKFTCNKIGQLSLLTILGFSAATWAADTLEYKLVQSGTGNYNCESYDAATKKRDLYADPVKCGEVVKYKYDDDGLCTAYYGPRIFVFVKPEISSRCGLKSKSKLRDTIKYSHEVSNPKKAKKIEPEARVFSWSCPQDGKTSESFCMAQAAKLLPACGLQNPSVRCDESPKAKPKYWLCSGLATNCFTSETGCGQATETGQNVKKFFNSLGGSKICFTGGSAKTLGGSGVGVKSGAAKSVH